MILAYCPLFEGILCLTVRYLVALIAGGLIREMVSGRALSAPILPFIEGISKARCAAFEGGSLSARSRAAVP